MARLRHRSVVDEANEHVLITAACRLIGMDVPDDLSRSMKVHCPFGAIYHSDHGIDRTMRIYVESNHAHCFSRCGHFTPVGLVAMAWGMPRRAAAVELLHRLGRTPPTLAEAWALATTPDTQPDATMLGEALKTFCARITPRWADVQFQPSVAGRLTKCLALLDLVRTPDDARLWLTGCKQAMTTALERAQDQPH